MAEKESKKVTFIMKDAISCPVCGSEFKREELFSGRVNAGDLTDELHRKYIPMAAYGEIFPLVYDLTSCPLCNFSAFKNDFKNFPKNAYPLLAKKTDERIEAVKRIFPSVDFNAPRGLIEGAASCYLAMMCYDYADKEIAPTIRQAISALRAAWLLGYLHKKQPKENYNYVAEFFYVKARFFYKLATEKEKDGSEAFSKAGYLGPDTDKNYGYEGVLYLKGLLDYRYCPHDPVEARIASIKESKQAIARMFGLGKRSKSKPGPLLEKAAVLYRLLKTELDAHDADVEEDEEE